MFGLSFDVRMRIREQLETGVTGVSGVVWEGLMEGSCFYVNNGLRQDTVVPSETCGLKRKAPFTLLAL